MPAMSPIAANLQALRGRISDALGGERRDVTVVAVSKQKPAEDVRAAFDAGCRDLGENYVQEALPKIAALREVPITWHYIGHLQTNKARDVAEHFDWVHGIDRAKAAAALARARPASRGALNVCLQVNISDEKTKGGVAPSEAAALAREVAALPSLRLRGLMGMAQPSDDASVQRAQFRALKATFDALVRDGFALDTLSMGMSQDFEAALAEGATMLRIGTAIFGERQRKAAA
jgi:pyridoxal phosphate enzyme (YggS family)